MISLAHISLVNSVKSTYELIQILKDKQPYNKVIAFLNVESLFTNVPVKKKKIDILLNNIYNDPSLPTLKINKRILSLYTKVPFTAIKGIFTLK